MSATRDGATRRRAHARAGTALLCAAAVALSGCASRAVDVMPQTTDPADFALWDCARIDDEVDRVQRRAADVAYDVDERAGNNILALSVGVTIFWPAIVAMRSNAPEAAELARLKGRYEALRSAAATARCPDPGRALSPERAAAWTLQPGARLVYEERSGVRTPAREWVLSLVAPQRDETLYRLETAGGAAWRQDPSGNVREAPPGQLLWPRLLRADLQLGQLLTGDVLVAGEPLARARLRGQVMAVGPQVVAGHRFEVAVVELFGDAMRGDDSTRVEGAIAVDRRTGMLLRLDLRSAVPAFALQRRLVSIE